VLAALGDRAQLLTVLDGVLAQHQVTLQTQRREDSGWSNVGHVNLSYLHAGKFLWNIGFGTKLHVLVLVGDAAPAMERPGQEASSWAGVADGSSARQMAIQGGLEKRKVYATKHCSAPLLASKSIGFFAEIGHVKWEPSYIILEADGCGRSARCLSVC